MHRIKPIIPGVALAFGVALIAVLVDRHLLHGWLGPTLLALILGMLLNPLVGRIGRTDPGLAWTSKRILRVGIILAGISLSFAQVAEAGAMSLVLFVFTFATAFGVGYLVKRAFAINWKLASLLSCSTAICGGTAVATVGPTIRAKNRDIAYAISATFIFDLLTVIIFPWIGRELGLSDTGYGLWIGTAVNDTSSVVAAGYAFSDAAGQLATIVKLTRTLFIVPITLGFAWIAAKREPLDGGTQTVHIAKIFPWFILGFLAMVGVRTLGIIPEAQVAQIATASKFLLAMALAAIGLKTSLGEVREVGIKPMVAGVLIDVSVVLVALVAQAWVVRLFT